MQQALASIAPSVQAGKYVRTWLGTARGEHGKTRVTLIWEPLPQAPGASGTLSDFLFGSTGPRGGHREGMIESAAKSMSRSIGSRMGREILRGVMGTIFGSRR